MAMMKSKICFEVKLYACINIIKGKKLVYNNKQNCYCDKLKQ